MRWLIILALGCSGATTREDTTPDPEPVPQPELVAPGAETRCVVESGEETQTWQFLDGAVVKLIVVGDAAGTMLEERFTRDDTGRVVRVEVELVEGVGAGAVQAQTIRYEPGPDPNQLEMRLEVDGEAQTVRWTYDERGFPVSSEIGEQTTTCRRDAQGRIIARDGYRFHYRGDARFPYAMHDPTSDRTVPVHRFYDGIAVPGEYDALYTLKSAARRWRGACGEVFFGSCSATLAPPPPSRAPPEPDTDPLAARASVEEVARVDLGCNDPNPEAEDGCTFEIVHRAEHESGDLRGAAVVRIAVGPQEEASTHLAIARADGWWLGSQLADGPFNGNQTTGTLRFRTQDLSLMQVVDGSDPEVVIRYETERVFTDEHEHEHQLEEAGAIVCLDVASNRQRCTRIPYAIDDMSDDARRTVRSDLVFAGDGIVQFRGMQGAHPDVPDTEVVPIEWFFESLP